MCNRVPVALINILIRGVAWRIIIKPLAIHVMALLSVMAYGCGVMWRRSAVFFILSPPLVYLPLSASFFPPVRVICRHDGEIAS
jgi:hypothetical protein